MGSIQTADRDNAGGTILVVAASAALFPLSGAGIAGVTWVSPGVCDVVLDEAFDPDRNAVTITQLYSAPTLVTPYTIKCEEINSTTIRVSGFPVGFVPVATDGYVFDISVFRAPYGISP